MASQIESGISTYLGHFRQLIAACNTFGAAYNPQIPELKINDLETQLVIAKRAVDNVDWLLPTFLTAEGIRHEKFVILPPLATRVQAAAVAIKLPAAILTRIKEVVHKIRGQRAHKLKPQDLVSPDGEKIKHISVSQASFNEQIEHFNQLIDLVASQSAYTPAETDLTVASLTALLEEMRDTNNGAMAALTPLTAARQERNKLLFTPATGLIDTALSVKEYVKSVFGAASPQYKEVQHISFQNRKI